MASKRGNPTDMSNITDDPEMLATLNSSSTLGKQATSSLPAKPLKGKDREAAANASLMAMYDRVDKARAIKGKPSLPKPGTKEYRQ